ncbi:Pseudouridine-5'-phosphate glycosidase [Operophtera brumata]|uniref:Pseudouridine-5'-phosphate glycosidase n=1 Tax=Operophtera brumata TaxID=104452 RepID=A0A0L7LUK2_OPEBR|nr:Pseudouridine-5'-phosphate glycosidase [Operophtera brumata]
MAFLLKCMTKGTRSFRRCISSYPMVFSDEVLQAKVKGQPLGAVPATIAILKGQLTIGLTKEQIHYLAQAKGVVKASRRDLAPIAAAKLDGATTVAGTIIAAELADIPIFVTGGIDAEIEEAIDKALNDAKQKEIRGKEVTPFILAAVAKATRGASLDANIALIKNNAKVGADIAVQYKEVQKDSKGVLRMGFGVGKSSDIRRHFHTSCERRGGNAEAEDADMPLFPAGHADGDVLVIGGANVDRTYRTTENVHVSIFPSS